MQKVTSILPSEFVGDMISFDTGVSAKARFETNASMTFDKMDVVKGQYIYSFAEHLAISLVPAKAALVGVADIKYSQIVKSGDVIYGLAELKRKTRKWIFSLGSHFR